MLYSTLGIASEREQVVKGVGEKFLAPPLSSQWDFFQFLNHTGDNSGANLKSISHRFHPILVEFALELTK